MRKEIGIWRNIILSKGDHISIIILYITVKIFAKNNRDIFTIRK